eukprot:4549496-Pyramimonas_sp.AAC.1
MSSREPLKPGAERQQVIGPVSRALIGTTGWDTAASTSECMAEPLSDVSGEQVEQQTEDTRYTFATRTLQLRQGLGGNTEATSRSGAIA